MTFFRATIAILLLTGCATSPDSPAIVYTPDAAGKTSQQGATPAEEAIAAADRPLDFHPWFTDVLGGTAAVALAEDRLQDARLGFDQIAASLTDPVLNPRARFLSALLSFRLGDNARALKELPALAEELPLLSELAFEAAATAAVRVKKFDLAREYSSRLPEFSEGRIFTVAEADKSVGRTDSALALYRDGAARFPLSDRHDEALAKIVECIAALPPVPEGADPAKQQAEVMEALGIIQLLEEQSPGEPWTRHAGAFEDRLLERAGGIVTPRKKESRAAEDALKKAEGFKRKMNHRPAEKEYSRAAKLAKEGGTLRCRARFGLAVSVENQREYSRAAGLFRDAVDSCAGVNAELHVRSLYRGGRSFMAVDQFEDAIAMFTDVEAFHTSHSYADDARLHRARCHLANGDRETFLELITTLAQLYPEGDMRSEALWQGARATLEIGDLETAAAMLKAYHDAFPVEKGWYTAGRAAFWLGRVAEMLGNLEEADRFYTHAILTAPFSYYMMLAYSRLKETAPARAAEVMKGLAPPGDPKPPVFSEELLRRYPEFALGVELVRLGLVSRGKRILMPLLQNTATDSAIHWATASLFRVAGQYMTSVELDSPAGGDWKERYPVGDDYIRWTLAYPQAFPEEVAAAAAESGVDRALIWAVMREESGFNEKVESWANAIGLMQLILPTAKAMGKTLNLTVTPKTLRDPAVNTRLGAAYLSHLSTKFDGHPALIIAGYNAGDGAVRRWLKESPEATVDMFVENIPYSQTRGYTKRVLSSYAVYRFLYDDAHPVVQVPFELQRAPEGSVPAQ